MNNNTIIIDFPEPVARGTHFYTIVDGRAIPLSPKTIWEKWQAAREALEGVLKAHGRVITRKNETNDSQWSWLDTEDCPCSACGRARAVLAGVEPEVQSGKEL